MAPLWRDTAQTRQSQRGIFVRIPSLSLTFSHVLTHSVSLLRAHPVNRRTYLPARSAASFEPSTDIFQSHPTNPFLTTPQKKLSAHRQCHRTTTTLHHQPPVRPPPVREPPTTVNHLARGHTTADKHTHRAPGGRLTAATRTHTLTHSARGAGVSVRGRRTDGEREGGTAAHT